MSDKNLTIEITDEFCEMVMCTALEGGIGYWCDAFDLTTRKDDEKVVHVVSFTARDCEDDEILGEVSYDTIRKGVRAILNPGQRLVLDDIVVGLSQDFFGGREKWGTGIDADVADAIVQIGLFNDLVYGRRDESQSQ